MLKSQTEMTPTSQKEEEPEHSPGKLQRAETRSKK